MGYTTDFEGWFDLDEPLTEAQAKYLNTFSSSRRMKRDASIAATFPDPIREAVNLPIGEDGGYYVGNNGDMLNELLGYGQDRDTSVVDYNDPPGGQPGLWCQWVVGGDDNNTIQWDEGEKFYEYATWLEYIVNHFLKPWGRTLNGKVRWRGEDFSDVGVIVVKDNVVTTKDVSW